MEPLSRTTTPNRLGFTSGAPVATPTEGASVRDGLNRLRAATTLYALAGGRGPSIGGAPVPLAVPRRPPTGSGIGAMNCRAMYRTSTAARAASTTFAATSLLGIYAFVFAGCRMKPDTVRV